MPPSPFTALALAAVRVYQRWVSPYKGFACAHRVHRGGPGCSAVGARLLRRYGVWNGWPLLRQRLRACGEVHRAHHPPPPRWFTGLVLRQRGDCDFPCDLDGGADSDGCDGRGRGRWSALDCCDCGCDLLDLFDRDDRKKRNERRSQRQKRRAF